MRWKRGQRGVPVLVGFGDSPNAGGALSAWSASGMYKAIKAFMGRCAEDQDASVAAGL